MVVWSKEYAGEEESLREKVESGSVEVAEGLLDWGRMALNKSKRKVAEKGKKKVVEPAEAVEIEEMDLFLHYEDEAEEVEVVTPKAKKIKTSKKKSPSKTKSAEPSTLVKRTMSTLKSRKAKVLEEEESEEKEKSDAEKDKMVKPQRVRGNP
ncbi:protein pxr1-like [Nicotiana tomentosiformis]|uniref:protein pxr1-like n=1 Tax=Nicotiana tomentosiformis TaxID=4098 RepID=UPI00388CBF73